MPRMRWTAFSRVRLSLSLQNTDALLTPILSLNLVGRAGGKSHFGGHGQEDCCCGLLPSFFLSQGDFLLSVLVVLFFIWIR